MVEMGLTHLRTAANRQARVDAAEAAAAEAAAEAEGRRRQAEAAAVAAEGAQVELRATVQRLQASTQSMSGHLLTQRHVNECPLSAIAWGHVKPCACNSLNHACTSAGRLAVRQSDLGVSCP